MALIKCKECGGAVSSSAAICPHCGAKPRRRIPSGLGSIVAVVLLVVVLWRLASSGGDGTDGPRPVARPVHPAELEHSRSFELGELVLLLMPDARAGDVGWDHRADSGILWETAGYTAYTLNDGVRYERKGIVRSNVEGAIATVLLQRKVELGWTVTYRTSSNPAHGPEEISIEPGLPDEGCFGSIYDGCWFDEPLKSLKDAGIGMKRLCKVTFAEEGISAFELTHAGRRSTVMLWTQSGGSGGRAAWLKLELNTRPSTGLCKGISDPSAPLPSQPEAQAQDATPASQPSIQAASPAISASGTPNTPIDFDQQAADEEAVFTQLLGEAKDCMHEGALVMLRQGSRDREQIVAFEVHACAGQLVDFMIGIPHGRSCRSISGAPCTPVTKGMAESFAALEANKQLEQVVVAGR